MSRLPRPLFRQGFAPRVDLAAGQKNPIVKAGKGVRGHGAAGGHAGPPRLPSPCSIQSMMYQRARVKLRFSYRHSRLARTKKNEAPVKAGEPPLPGRDVVGKNPTSVFTQTEALIYQT